MFVKRTKPENKCQDPIVKTMPLNVLSIGINLRKILNLNHVVEKDFAKESTVVLVTLAMKETIVKLKEKTSKNA